MRETSINTCHVEDIVILLTTVINNTTHTHTHIYKTFISEAYQIQVIRLIVATE